MNVFTGEIAAFGMLALIWTLLLVFLKECKILPIKRESFTSSYMVMGIGLGYLLLGGFIYNLRCGQASVLQYDVVWGFGRYGELLENVTEGRAGSLFSEAYLCMARGLGALFFGEYKAGLFYLSFLLTLFNSLMLQDILEKLFDEVNQKRLWILFFVLPYSYRLFLPSPHALLLFLVVGVVWVVFLLKKVKRMVLQDNYYRTLGYGIVLTIFTCLNTVLYFTEMTKGR